MESTDERIFLDCLYLVSSLPRFVVLGERGDGEQAVEGSELEAPFVLLTESPGDSEKEEVGRRRV